MLYHWTLQILNSNTTKHTHLGPKEKEGEPQKNM